MTTPNASALTPLPAEAVRWTCDPKSLPFDSSKDIEPTRIVVGQDAAVEALSFGLEHYAPGQNVFVRGLTGTGRMTLIHQLLENIVPSCRLAPDRCYVHNFDQPDRPTLISLPRNTGRDFSRQMDDFITFLREEFTKALTTDAVRARTASLERAAQERAKSVIQPFEDELKANGLALVFVHSGPVTQGAIFPVIDGRPIPPEEYGHLHAAGEVTDEAVADFHAKREAYQEKLDEVTGAIMQQRLEHQDAVRGTLEREARMVLDRAMNRVRQQVDDEAVHAFLDAVIDDIIENRLAEMAESLEFTRLYRVNVLIDHDTVESCPIIVENSPTMLNLLGSIDLEMGPGGMPQSDHMMVHGGSLLRADGGYLIIDARDVISEPGSWKFLVRTLRTGLLEIVPPELNAMWGRHTIKPEPIPIDVKVVMVGDTEIYYTLDQLDADFPNLFKVLADFDSEIPRDEAGVRHYGTIIARIVNDEALPEFDRTAIAALVEHGARIAARAGKLTARFSRLADVVREAAFLARKAGHVSVTGDDVRETVARTKRRASLPSRRFRELLTDGTIRVETRGEVVGQINGLAVLSAGQLMYGFPARITASIGPGTAGLINIEREADLSGAIHTKGFHILHGLLHHLLQTDHPLVFDASIAFEQSYGGIDGDSASGAEMCCLLSALTKIPIHQEFAMTGAIDQLGHLQAIGGVNEKIEGFFDTCRDLGLTGNQGVVIPSSNAGDLMLRPDVVEACRDGLFHVYAVSTIQDAMSLVMGRPAGVRDQSGRYPTDSILGGAVERAHLFWGKAKALGVTARSAEVGESARTASAMGEPRDHE